MWTPRTDFVDTVMALDVNESYGATLQNVSGAQRVATDVVVLDTVIDNAYKTTNVEADPLVIGVVAETTAQLAQGLVQDRGVCTLRVDAATNNGDWLVTSTTPTMATPKTTFQGGVFAMALETVGGAGTIDALLSGGASSWNNTGQIILTAAGGWPSTTNGCAANALTEYGTNDVDMYSLDFDTASDEYAQWSLAMPFDWNGGTLTAIFYWTAAGGAGTVAWNLQGRSYGDSDAIDQAWGTTQEVVDTLITAADVHNTAATAAITLAGTPAAEEFVQFRAWRDVSDDTLGVDARLLMVKVAYTRI